MSSGIAISRTTLPAHPVGPTGLLPTVQVDWKLNDASWFEATFVVTLPPGATWHSSPAFSSTNYALNWNLWDYDVVEVFVQARSLTEGSTAPYYELQLSPLGQPFALHIEEPRRRYGYPQMLVYTKETHYDTSCWFTRLAVQIPDYQPGAPLFGNFTACLGPIDQRAYFAMAPSTSSTPDFHRPQEFMQLI